MVKGLLRGALGSMLMVGVAAGLGACNTMVGVGKDMAAAGRALSGSAERTKNGGSPFSASNGGSGAAEFDQFDREHRAGLGPADRDQPGRDRLGRDRLGCHQLVRPGHGGHARQLAVRNRSRPAYTPPPCPPPQGGRVVLPTPRPQRRVGVPRDVAIADTKHLKPEPAGRINYRRTGLLLSLFISTILNS